MGRDTDAATPQDPGAGERRFRTLTFDEMTPEQRAVAENIRCGPRAGTGATSLVPGANTIGGPFNPWLRNPELADLLQKLGSHVRFKSSLPARLTELAILVTARLWNAQYEWFAHHRLAMQAGLDPKVAEDVAAGRRPTAMQDDEAIVHDFSHEMHTTRQVSDVTFKAAVDTFGEHGAMDLIAINGYYVLVSMTLNVDRTPLPDGVKPPLPML